MSVYRPRIKTKYVSSYLKVIERVNMDIPPTAA